MKRLLCGCVLALLLLVAPALGAGQTATLFAFGGSAVSITQVPADMSGQLTVSFHGDPSTGCAAQGLCGYSGTVIVAPGSGAVLLITKVRSHGHLADQVQLNLLGDVNGGVTAANVRRAGGGECGDAQQPTAVLDGTINHGNVSIPLFQAGSGLISTRCAGPLDADLAGSGPRLELPLGQLRRGHGAADLSGSWPFSAAGFAGTVVSSLRISLGTPSTQRANRGANLPRGIRTETERQVIENVTLVRASGSLSLSLRGDPAGCAFVDSCGIQGTLNAVVAPVQASGTLFVLGPARRPNADFLAALGLSRHGNPRGLAVGGDFTWQRGGSVAAALNQGNLCDSSAPLGGGLINFREGAPGLIGSYSLIPPARTRCPGPVLGAYQPLATGRLNLAQRSRRTLTLNLNGSRPLSDDGYLITPQASLIFTFRRGPVREHSFLAPAP